MQANKILEKIYCLREEDARQVLDLAKVNQIEYVAISGEASIHPSMNPSNHHPAAHSPGTPSLHFLIL